MTVLGDGDSIPNFEVSTPIEGHGYFELSNEAVGGMGSASVERTAGM